jgi:hypothetical protein
MAGLPVASRSRAVLTVDGWTRVDRGGEQPRARAGQRPAGGLSYLGKPLSGQPACEGVEGE